MSIVFWWCSTGSGIFSVCPCIISISCIDEGFRSDVVVSLDANFAQKCRKSKCDDPPIAHPETHFLSEAHVSLMEKEVAEARQHPPKKGDHKQKKGGTHKEVTTVTSVPDAVLDECERSFLAAQDKVAKASRDFYSDTGLMALICRHDRLLWIANLTSPGEKQHYALALLQQLFENIPENWTVGLLYDIACQIERSVLKVCVIPIASHTC
jgi:hypothetical protein